MRNLITRTILFVVAVPAIIATIVFLPFRNQLAISVVAVLASALGASELANFFEKKDAGYRASSVTIPLLGAAIPLTQLLISQELITQSAVAFVIFAVVGVVLMLQIVRREDEGFAFALTNTAANTMLLVYPGLFLSYLIRIGAHEHATALLLLFLCMVFANDTVAYLTGMAYRAIRTRAAEKAGRTWEARFVLPVSPHKTMVGFLGGLLAAPATFLVARALFPDHLPFELVPGLLLSLAVGVATIAGDLIESALKRSATRKDSGSIIPGRGGVLDSIDSVLYAAPVFYYLLRYTL
jgi:phosphatidate cytidylyltransferase